MRMHRLEFGGAAWASVTNKSDASSTTADGGCKRASPSPTRRSWGNIPICCRNWPPNCSGSGKKRHKQVAQARASDEATLRLDHDVAASSDDATLPLDNGGEIPQSAADAVTTAADPAAPPPPTATIRYFGDYELLEVLGRGGMGVVYKARQKSLNRIVAVKMILTGQFASQDGVQRFQAEAEAAARLEHPGIVPIYEIGQHDGHHYFSMQFVQGHSLAETLRENPLPSRQAADYLQKIALAMAYAHSRGVLHRDLKPGNVLIDLDDQPHVTDFGLAKRVDSDSEMTATGQVLGTPSYMPPEQALGEHGQMGPQSDVYSLGAVLYALVTGRPPFQTDSVASTLLQVVNKDVVEPRSLNPAIDRDLETICLKCLEKEPARRYQSAQALADELGRYLRSEPILARPLSAALRVWRWCRRKPLVAGLSAAVLLLMIIGTAVSTYFAVESSQNAAFFRSERDRANNKTKETEQALKREREALSKQQAALEETEQTIDQYVDTVENAELLREPRFQPLLRELLKDARAHYERYINRHGAGLDSEHQEKLAQSLTKIGELNYYSGSHEESLDAYQRALAIWKRLVNQHPDAVQYPPELAECYRRIGAVSFEMGDHDAALEANESSFAILSDLVQRYPTDQKYRELLATSYRWTAQLQGAVGNRAEESAAYARMLELCDELATEAPDNAQFQYNLAIAHQTIGDMHRRQGDAEQAAEAYDRGLVIAKPLSAAHADALNYQFLPASLYKKRGALFKDAQIPQFAVPLFEKSRDILQRLAREHPNINWIQSEFADVQRDLGLLYTQTDQWPQAQATLESALELHQRSGARIHRSLSIWIKRQSIITNSQSSYKDSASPMSPSLPRDGPWRFGGRSSNVCPTLSLTAEVPRWH